MFEALLQGLDHGRGVEAVHEAVVEGGRQIHDPADRDRAVDDPAAVPADHGPTAQ